MRECLGCKGERRKIMPRPEMIEKRNQAKQVSNRLNQLLDNDAVLDALDEVERSPEPRRLARQNAAEYLRGRGVNIPNNTEVTIEAESPLRICASIGRVRVCVEF
jgi:hypothetical protein